MGAAPAGGLVGGVRLLGLPLGLYLRLSVQVPVYSRGNLLLISQVFALIYFTTVTLSTTARLALDVAGYVRGCTPDSLKCGSLSVAFVLFGETIPWTMTLAFLSYLLTIWFHNLIVGFSGSG